MNGKIEIEVGDEVLVTFASDGSSLLGVLHHIPTSAWDTWKIIDEDGVVTHVQMFERLELINKAEEMKRNEIRRDKSPGRKDQEDMK